jgi:prepilin-type N-terminal cleavage/methylation domain-containing protein/prepilin-type processing-associated H-X9-DG protein
VSGVEPRFNVISFISAKVKSKKSAEGFTLIELLVVITVVTLLLSILMPSLSKAREVSRRLKCGSGTRTMAQVVLYYEQDHKTFIPTAWYDSSPTPDSTVISSYFGYENATTPDRARLFFRTNGCPSYVWSSVSDGGLPVWGYNRHLTADGTSTVGINFLTNKSQDIRHTTEVFFWTDLQSPVTGATGGLWHNSSIAFTTAGTFPFNGTTAILPRHEGQGVNFSFVDGHAQFITIQGGGNVSYTPKPTYSPYKPRQSDYVNN